MEYIKWANSKVRKMNIWDIKLIKLSVFAFALMVAKLWSPILSLEWYWYLVLWAAFVAKPLYKVFSK